MTEIILVRIKYNDYYIKDNLHFYLEYTPFTMIVDEC